MNMKIHAAMLLLPLSFSLACDVESVDNQGDRGEVTTTDGEDGSFIELGEGDDIVEPADDSPNYAFTEATFTVVGRTTGSLTSPSFEGVSGTGSWSTSQPTVTRQQKGIYTVNMQKTPPSSRFIAQVTPIGVGNTFCRVAQTSGKLVDISCHDSAGNPADTYFGFYATNNVHGNGAILRTTSAGSSPSSISVTSGSSTSVVRNSTGRYTVTLNGVTWLPTTATILVNSYGSYSYVLCKPYSWSTSGGNTTIPVRCDNISGGAADSTFMVAMISTPKVQGDLTGNYSFGYVASGGSISGVKSDFTFPTTQLVSSLSGGVYKLSQAGLGSYEWGRTWSVVSIDNNANYCKLQWASTLSGNNSEVKCFTRGGSGVNSAFSALLTRAFPPPID